MGEEICDVDILKRWIEKNIIDYNIRTLNYKEFRNWLDKCKENNITTFEEIWQTCQFGEWKLIIIDYLGSEFYESRRKIIYKITDILYIEVKQLLAYELQLPIELVDLDKTHLIPLNGEDRFRRISNIARKIEEANGFIQRLEEIELSNARSDGYNICVILINIFDILHYRYQYTGDQDYIGYYRNMITNYCNGSLSTKQVIDKWEELKKKDC